MTAIATPLLQVEGLRVSLGGTAILHGASLEVESGEVVGLVGPNGAGKSTLLRAITRVLPARGSIALGGCDVGSLDRRALFRRVAVVQQLPQAPEAMRVEDLVLLGRHPHLGLLGRESASDSRIAREAMERAGCARFAERTLGTLSGGERRRAFVARALAQEPALLLLDEPTANLDAAAQAEIFQLLRDVAKSGAGVLVVVHDLTLAAAYCDRLVLLDGGRVVAEGPPAAVVTPELVARVYGPHLQVIPHPVDGTPIVAPAARRPPGVDGFE